MEAAMEVEEAVEAQVAEVEASHPWAHSVRWATVATTEQVECWTSVPVPSCRLPVRHTDRPAPTTTTVLRQ